MMFMTIFLLLDMVYGNICKNNIAEGTLNISLGPIENIKSSINRSKELIESNEINQALLIVH